MNIVKKEIFVIFFGLLLQFCLVSYDFPLSELFTETPLFYVDNAYHWYYLKFLNNIWLDGLLTGYDPFFNAGAPAGIATDLSGHAAQVFALLVRNGLSEIEIWKLYIFTIAVIGPILPAIGIWALGLDVVKIVVALSLGILIWWVSWFHWFHAVGMGSYVFASFLSLLVILLFIRYRASNGFWRVFFVSVLSATLIFIHPVIILLVLIVLSCFFAFNIQGLANRKTVIYLAVFILASFMLNAWWLKLYFSPLYQTAYKVVLYQADVSPANILYELLGQWKEHTHGSKVYSLLFLLSIIAVFQVSGKIRRLYIWPFLTAWFILQLYASLAGMIPMLAKLTQPNRFAPAGYLLLIVPSIFAVKCPGGIVELLSVPRKRLYSAALLVAGLIFAVNITELYREVSYGEHGRYAVAPPNVKATGPYSDFVLSVLKKETDASARVLFETSMGRVHDDAHLAGYYAYSSDREFIGGPYTSSSFAGFRDGFVFGSPIEDIPPEKFVEYLNLYNIGWVIAHSDKSKSYFNKISNMTPGPSFRELQFYTVNAKHDFFIKGAGVIKKRDHNLIELSELSDDVVELKYHYFPDFKANVDVKIEAASKMDDPIPFIRIIKPPKELLLRFEP
ncbi:MAG: hypothetical protein ACXVA0_21270 [Mucilaginibacter sp.]